jgi:hypothetical protein
MTADVDTIDTGRPWPFHVTLEVHPFEQRLTVHVAVEPESGGMTPDEADTCMASIEVARDLALSYAESPPTWG